MTKFEGCDDFKARHSRTLLAGIARTPDDLTANRYVQVGLFADEIPL